MPKFGGFSLIELLVVVSIIAVLSVVGIVVFNGVTTNSKTSTTKGTLVMLRQAMIRYKINNGELPPTGDSCPNCIPDNSARADNLRNGLLSALVSGSGGPYIADIEQFVYDPWGIAYWYDDNDEGFSPGPGACQSGAWESNSPLYSSGPDKVAGNGDDIHFDIRCP